MGKWGTDGRSRSWAPSDRDAARSYSCCFWLCCFSLGSRVSSLQITSAEGDRHSCTPGKSEGVSRGGGGGGRGREGFRVHSIISGRSPRPLWACCCNSFFLNRRNAEARRRSAAWFKSHSWSEAEPGFELGRSAARALVLAPLIAVWHSSAPKESAGSTVHTALY